MSIRTSPCTWDVSYEQCDPPAAWHLLTDQQRLNWEQMAVDLLWRWTGRTLGLCQESISPCPAMPVALGNTFRGRRWAPLTVSGDAYTITCGRCGDLCTCASPSLVLPGPVDSIVSVTIEGVELPATSYRVDNSRWLVRTDGLGWPYSLTGDFTVTYKRGVAVPLGGRVAAGRLALELWKASCNDKTCDLPQRVQSITRQGVTVTVLDTFDDLDKGHTGIWLIDSWVASMQRTPLGAAVYSVDTRRPRRATWQGV